MRPLQRIRREDNVGPSRTLSSLHVRNYRLYFYGQMVSVSGTWMQTVAQTYLVLRLTDNGTDLGLATVARFVPMLFFGAWGGAIVDRIDKQRVLYFTQSLQGILAFVFAAIVYTHVVEMWMVYLLAVGLGFVNSVDNPARQAFISEMVPQSELRNAVTLNSVTMNMARIIGPAIAAGIIALLGIALCFVLNAASFGAVLVSLALMRRAELFPSVKEPRRKGQVREGLRYVMTTSELLIPLIMITVVGTFAWEFSISLPLLAKDTFHGGVTTYGTMMSVMGVGAVIGGLVTARRSNVSARGLSVSAVAWGIFILGAAFAPSLPIELAILLFVGYGSISFNSLAKTTLQLVATPEMRGRVMALWAIAWLGSTPIGGPIVGWVGQNIGARWSLVIGGVPTVLSGLLTYRVLSRVDRRHQDASSETSEAIAATA